ncbi:MAG: mucoidy inhibitor MuiA family protein, partial [bacterium]
MPLRSLLASVLLAAAAPSVAGPVPVDTAPRAVTVYPSGALVERGGDARLEAGLVTVVFPDLPAGAEEASLRLSAVGPAGTKLFGVRLRSAFTAETVEKRVKELSDKIRDLEDRRTDLKDRMEARNAELEILKALAKDATGKGGAPSAAKPLGDPVATAKAAGERIAQLAVESRKDERAQRALEPDLAALQRELQQIGSGSRERKTAEADLELSKAGSVEFKLTYRVPNAGWTPLYDVRLDTEQSKPSVALTFAGQVRQQSGEDWKDVKLVLSTAHPTEASQIPDPSNWWLDFAPPPLRVMQRKSRAAAMAPAAAMRARESMAMEGGGVEAEEAAVPVETEQAETVSAEYATSFAPTRPMNVPSDGGLHRVGIADSSHAAVVRLVSVPRLAQAAFIEATVSYGGDQPLLPGPANLFRGAEFTGTTALHAIGPGETFPLGFGQDGNVKVERKLLAQQGTDAPKWFTKAFRKYRWVTTLKSGHAGVRTIEVREQMPRSRQKDIVVEVQDPSPKPL